LKIKNIANKWTDINKNTYEEYLGENTCQLGEGVGCIKTDDPDAAERLKTAVTGSDGVYAYYFFMMNLGANKNKTSYIINNHPYTVLLKGEVPITIDDNMAEGLPLFALTMLENKGDETSPAAFSSDELDYNLLASEYFGSYSYAKYNEEFYYFHPSKFRWLPLKGYDDFNILISLKNRNYLQKHKRQIMDSMMIYLDTLENKTLNKDLLLFKNNKVLNIKNLEVTDFDGSQFIVRSLEANWYENPLDVPKPDTYMDKVLKDLTGMNIYKSPAEERRYEDLLIYIGYILTDMQKQNGLMMFGKSQNGKSTLASVIGHTKGSVFMPEINPLINDAHYTSGFINDRLLFFDELKPEMVSEKFVSVFNKLLGNQKLSVRPMNQSPRTVHTNFTAIVTINELSEQFVTYRALLRRVKIMNSTFPVVTNLPPSINLVDELMKQNNIDWLANTCVRKFVLHGFKIDDLFVDDMAYWIYQLNSTARKYLKMLIKEGYIGEDLKLKVTTENFKLEQSQQTGLSKELKWTGDIAVFDEQINIVFQYVLRMNDLSCVNGGVTWR